MKCDCYIIRSDLKIFYITIDYWLVVSLEQRFAQKEGAKKEMK